MGISIRFMLTNMPMTVDYATSTSISTSGEVVAGASLRFICINSFISKVELVVAMDAPHVT
jgi:hypothetical protein